MDVDRWTIVDALFEQAVEMAAQECSAFLDEKCRGDSELRHEVEQMLRAHDRAEGFLGDSAAESAADLIRDQVLATDRPTRVGSYRIVDEVARGGMGAVFAGERDDEDFDQRVAIKVLQQGVATADVHRRFLSERRILASLEHDHIARIYDGGVLEDGRPYFVMEYVDGLAIDRFCDERNLDLRGRLKLIREVADTVTFAHQNLIIHRDLKPSNIMVTPEGRVKLLDFGLAKVLEGDTPEGPEIPTTRTRWMTPEYASPEQILGRPVTTATDVYQLAVVAYEILTGVRPFHGDGKSMFEIERAICEEPVPRPSLASRETDDARTGVQQSTWSRALAGDVDAILLKALRKEPGERYASAAEFSADISRFLDGLPVLARQGTTAYRARKFVRRNRWRLGVAGASAGVLLVATVAYFVQVNAARADAERAAERASIEQAKAERVASFLAGLFEAGDLEASRGDTLTVFDLVERGVDQLDDLRDEPAVQARLALVIGDVYHKLSKLDESEALLARSADILRRAPEAESMELPQALEALHDLSVSKGDFEAAETYAREAVEAATKRYGGRHPMVARMTNRLGNALYYQGDTLAAQVYRNTLDLYRTSGEPDSAGVAAMLGNLGLMEKRAGRLQEAEAHLRESISILSRLEGTEERIADATRNLATVMRDQGRLEETKLLYREHVAQRRAISGDTSVSVSAALAFLGSFQEQVGEYEEAARSHAESLEILKHLFGTRHQYAAMAMNNLANAYRLQGRYDEAWQLFEESLEIRRSLFGASHYRVATVLRQLGNMLSERGNEEAALGYFQEALSIRRGHFGLEHKDTANSLNDVAASLHQLGRYDEAERVLDEARQAWAAISDPDNGRSRTSYLLGRLLLTRGHLSDSEKWARESIVERQSRFGDHDWRTAASKSLLGECLMSQGRLEEAKELLTEARMSLTGKAGVPGKIELVRTVERLALLHEQLGDSQRAGHYRAELARLDSRMGAGQ